MFSKGADVDALRDSAGRMASFGREVDVVRARGQRAVSTMQGAWHGPDLQHLVERWRRVEHDLTRISTEFDRLSRRLHDNADLQHRSSGTSVGDGGSHHSVGGGGAAAPTSDGQTTGHTGGGAGGHGGRPTLHAAPAAAWSQVLVGWGPDGGRPIVTPGVPQPLHGMGWGLWFGSPSAGAGSAPVDAAYGPALPADVAAATAHGLGLPIR
ncbi:hypothetical protein [Terracoccus sp. 273MFTsu3.1]|uniref:hypothetical protein n=1 Tax=Terracoccus sp. 273MFTsu3.1 TaxID=1172188 RepID=UPI0003A6FEF2|nr:hypothetical protein [Terracoccus sp. 273MFTsu3.1]